MAIYSCKDCPDRYPGCHGECEKYREEKALHDARKAEERRKIETACGIYEQRSKAIRRVTKHRAGRGFGRRIKGE